LVGYAREQLIIKLLCIGLVRKLQNEFVIAQLFEGLRISGKRLPSAAGLFA